MAWLEAIEIDGGRGFRVLPPGGGEPLREFRVTTADEVATAIGKARSMQSQWGATSVSDRVAIVDRAVQLLIERQEHVVATSARSWAVSPESR